MGNQLLIVTAILLCATIVAADDDGKVVSERFRPFCYCPRGYVPRYINVWPYYKCYRFVRDLASWAEAKVYCGVMRAHMAEDRDSATHYWLRLQLTRLRKRNRHHLLEKQEYWLGATDLEYESRWVWDPSNTPVSWSSSFWIQGEPNRYLGYQNCMAIKRRPYTNINTYYYDWFDDDCYQKKFYICERYAWCCWDWSCLRKLEASKVKFEKKYLPEGVTKAKMTEAKRQ